ncbi:MAG: type II toxin-antitoxin system RelE/ParE family toxin [Candidatus Hydrogenedentes bacterium]|nr:type II toxin-antitoxin system RelE/ParE family toxin [Candidatus Hydrogenedentota bacterium]
MVKSANKQRRKQVVFVGRSQRDIQKFPESVRYTVGQAIDDAVNGDKHPSTKVMQGFGGASVVEIVSRAADGTYRVVYTTMMADFVVVLHAFKKKSVKGIATPKKEIDMIKSRLREAKNRYGG